MKKGIHRGLGLLLAIVVVAMLAACSTKDSVSEVPDKDDSDAIVPPASVLPFADVVDLSEYFVDEPVEFSESTPKGELVCVNIDESQYSKADDTILLPNEKTKAMAVHCTWASASRTIYIGFIDEVSEEVYTLSAVGGALTGTLDLSSLPEGEYRPIMYSSDNQNINAVSRVGRLHLLLELLQLPQLELELIQGHGVIGRDAARSDGLDAADDAVDLLPLRHVLIRRRVLALLLADREVASAGDQHRWTHRTDAVPVVQVGSQAAGIGSQQAVDLLMVHGGPCAASDAGPPWRPCPPGGGSPRSRTQGRTR